MLNDLFRDLPTIAYTPLVIDPIQEVTPLTLFEILKKFQIKYSKTKDDSIKGHVAEKCSKKYDPCPASING